MINENIQFYNNLYDMALTIARTAHHGQTDKAGKPYIEHPLFISAHPHIKNNIQARILAILHDVIEDTDVTLEQLTNLGFPEDIIRALDAISRRPGEKRKEYLKRVKGNILALKIKLIDLEHNSDEKRLACLDSTVANSLRKRYKKDIDFLTK